MPRLKVAIIGTGSIARTHYEALQSEPDRVELVAASDISQENLEKFCNAYPVTNRYLDTAQMLADHQPDLVHVCTPPGTHLQLSVQALEAGAHVLCEKPLVASLAEIDELQAAEIRTGRTCSSIFQWRFGSAGQHFKHLIDSGVLGRSLIGICQTTWYRDHAYYEVPWRGKWATELGGVSMGHGIHAMDFFLWLMGDWVEVSAMAGTLDRRIEVEDVSMAVVRFANGAMGSVVNSVLSPRQTSYMRFDFQRATVEAEHLYNYGNADWRYSIPEGATHTDELASWQAIAGDKRSTHAAQLSALLDALEANQPPLTNTAEVRSTIEFLTSLYKSAITHTPVKQGSIGPDDPFYHHLYGPEIPNLALAGD